MRYRLLKVLVVVLAAQLPIFAMGGLPEKPKDTRSALQQSLYDAIYKPDPAKVKALLDEGADSNGPAIQKVCDTPLMTAIYSFPMTPSKREDAERMAARVKVVQILLDHKADPNGPGCGSVSPIAMSIMFTDSPELVSSMIDHGADLTPSDTTPPLNAALYNGKLEMVKLLIKKGADVNFVNRSSRETPLHIAIKGRKRKTPNIEEIIKILEAAGAIDEPEKKQTEPAPKPKEEATSPSAGDDATAKQ